MWTALLRALSVLLPLVGPLDSGFLVGPGSGVRPFSPGLGSWVLAVHVRFLFSRGSFLVEFSDFVFVIWCVFPVPI